MKEDEFLRNWKTLKMLMLAKWAKLKEADLKEVQPRVGTLVQIIKSKYKDIPEQSILEDLENLSQQIEKNS